MTKMFFLFLCLSYAAAQSSDDEEQAQCESCGCNRDLMMVGTPERHCGHWVCEGCNHEEFVCPCGFSTQETETETTESDGTATPDPPAAVGIAVVPAAESTAVAVAPAAPARRETGRQRMKRLTREKKLARITELENIIGDNAPCFLRSSGDRRRRMSEGECAVLLCEYTTLSFELNTEGCDDCPICFADMDSRCVVQPACGHNVCMQCFQTQTRSASKNRDLCCICRVNLFDVVESEPEAPAAQIALPQQPAHQNFLQYPEILFHLVCCY